MIFFIISPLIFFIESVKCNFASLITTTVILESHKVTTYLHTYQTVKNPNRLAINSKAIPVKKISPTIAHTFITVDNFL